jgi:UDP-N-acetylglucosamine 2-epimerase (non-hydrolysing)
MLIHLICAARPNFMKIAPLYHALKKQPWARPVIIHTGQHYDLNMSDAFFVDLGLPAPDINLNVHEGSHARQTGRVMIAYEELLMEQRPDLVVVVGDVNSTMAATIAATKVVYPVPNSKYPVPNTQYPISQYPNNPVSQLPGRPCRPLVAHLEAGLRSFDRTMPEEINRLVTDSLADILWTPSPDADRNLRREGVASEKIVRVGNIMIDSLEMLRGQIEKQEAYLDFGLAPGGYGIVTLHRPSNVDNPDILKTLCENLRDIAREVPLVFPVHPRTRQSMEDNRLLSILESAGNLFLPEPLSYTSFMNLVFNCAFVITDSGGIQEETSYLGIPCLTVRENTERPVTITHGTNRLCHLEDLKRMAGEILREKTRKPADIELWDGRTADRIVASIAAFKNGFHMGGTITATRDQLHDRKGLR